MPGHLNEHQQQVMSFYAAMLTAHRSLTPEDRTDLENWERRYASTLGTSAWPGWREYIPDYLYIDFHEVSQAAKERRKKEAIASHIRWQVWERDDFTCQHCGSRQNLSVDHIKPESKGGTLELDNLQTLCKRCNSSKGNREYRNGND